MGVQGLGFRVRVLGLKHQDVAVEHTVGCPIIQGTDVLTPGLQMTSRSPASDNDTTDMRIIPHPLTFTDTLHPPGSSAVFLWHRTNTCT